MWEKGIKTMEKSHVFLPEKFLGALVFLSVSVSKASRACHLKVLEAMHTCTQKYKKKDERGKEDVVMVGEES